MPLPGRPRIEYLSYRGINWTQMSYTNQWAQCSECKRESRVYSLETKRLCSTCYKDEEIRMLNALQAKDIVWAIV